jgi:hypothetical protein
MVAPAMKSATAVAALLALVYLIVMVVSGALPQQRQLIRFEARGVMASAPETITRVELARGPDHAVLVRTQDGWRREPGPALPRHLSEQLSLAVQFMNTATPVRVLTEDEYQGTDLPEFGLERPRIAITLFDGVRPVLAARFGARTPDDMLDYMALDGHRGMFLMSRFVSTQWLTVMDGASAGR